MTSSNEPLNSVVAAISLAFGRFPDLLNASAQIAFSGGKDSIALAYALRAMGRPARLRAVDMGYSPDWRHRIEALAHALSLSLEILDVTSLIRSDEVDSSARKDLALRRAFLDDLGAADQTATPCTNCFNCKIISLAHTSTVVNGSISFGHHSRDALSSFLKSALMFYDRWVEGHTAFDKDAFRTLGNKVADELRSGELRYLRLFERYLCEGWAQTSEPPMERRSLYGRPHVIGRPMFFVEERETAGLAAALGIRAERSGCGHSAAASTRTPREIVHHELLPLIEETATGRAALRELLDMIYRSLEPDGTAHADVRGSRHLLLGSTYKGGPDQLADRL